MRASFIRGVSRRDVALVVRRPRCMSNRVVERELGAKHGDEGLTNRHATGQPHVLHRPD
jgi:hypothetical protein